MSFSIWIIQSVWEKGVVDPAWDSSIWRKDKYGTWMKRSDYGNRDSKYGWEIDHIFPASLGGSDLLFNLQPLHWKCNTSKLDRVPLLPLTNFLYKTI